MSSRCLSQQEVYLYNGGTEREKSEKINSVEILLYVSSALSAHCLSRRSASGSFEKKRMFIMPEWEKREKFSWGNFRVCVYLARVGSSQGWNEQHVWYFMTAPSDFYKVPMNYAISHRFFRCEWEKLVRLQSFFSSIFLRSDEKTPLFFALLPSRFIIYGSALDLLVVCLLRVEQGRDGKNGKTSSDFKNTISHSWTIMVEIEKKILFFDA